jgi:hypothetical protein
MDPENGLQQSMNEWIHRIHCILARIGTGARMDPQQPNEAERGVGSRGDCTQNGSTLARQRRGETSKLTRAWAAAREL